MQRIAILILLSALCGCQVSGTIGGKSDLERNHDVSVSITFADGG